MKNDYTMSVHRHACCQFSSQGQSQSLAKTSATVRTALDRLVVIPLVRGLGHYGQGVHAGLELVGQRLVNHTVSLRKTNVGGIGTRKTNVTDGRLAGVLIRRVVVIP